MISRTMLKIMYGLIVIQLALRYSRVYCTDYFNIIISG